MERWQTDTRTESDKKPRALSLVSSLAVILSIGAIIGALAAARLLLG